MSTNFIMLVDALAVAYRAFFAVRGLSTKSGFPTNAIYGFIKMLDQLEKKWMPQYCLVVFDGGLPKERMELLQSYKQQRPPMPDSLKKQLSYIEKYLEAVGFRWIRKEGMEADDVIASFAITAKTRWDMDVILATADKDFYQLVDDRIKIVPVAGKVSIPIGRKEVMQKFGVPPEQIPDLLALTGDASDNIPGVPGVGVKTAAAILNEFGGIDNLWQRIDEFPNEKIKNLLLENKELVNRNKKLTVLNVNYDLGLEKKSCLRKSTDENKLYELLKELEFKSLLKKMVDKKEENKITEQGNLFNA